MWDVFVSHASEDKEDVARPLAESLKAGGCRVWYDEYSLKVGDSLRDSIDEGLSKSKFGIVILSPNFFRKKWTRRELNGLIAKESLGEKVLLPIWHRLSQEDVARHSPILADRVALETSQGIPTLTKRLLEAIRRVEIDAATSEQPFSHQDRFEKILQGLAHSEDDEKGELAALSDDCRQLLFTRLWRTAVRTGIYSSAFVEKLKDILIKVSDQPGYLLGLHCISLIGFLHEIPNSPEAMEVLSKLSGDSRIAVNHRSLAFAVLVRLLKKRQISGDPLNVTLPDIFGIYLKQHAEPLVQEIFTSFLDPEKEDDSADVLACAWAVGNRDYRAKILRALEMYLKRNKLSANVESLKTILTA